MNDPFTKKVEDFIKARFFLKKIIWIKVANGNRLIATIPGKIFSLNRQSEILTIYTLSETIEW